MGSLFSYFFHGEIRTKSISENSYQTVLKATIYEWHICYLTFLAAFKDRQSKDRIHYRTRRGYENLLSRCFSKLNGS